MKCLIVSGGDAPSKNLIEQHLKDCDFYIGVDGGADLLSSYNLSADYIIGDFDTAKSINILKQQNGGAEIVRLNPRKNQTDTEAAVDLALTKGADEIVLLGALGSRQDHSLANIALLKYALDKRVSAKIVDENNELFVCKDNITLSAPIGQTISILPLYQNITVSAKGLEYPLKNLKINFGQSRGISNIISKSKVTITIKHGTALIILSNGNI